jgi:glycosyltransferase involved in cell wall biosynthesis
LFSIIIPLFNKSPYIQRAIDSVLNQEFKGYEIIVVNDGSTDGGGELVEEEYGSKIRIFNQSNSGVSFARNQGILHAKFSWIAFLDADDYWHPQYLAFMAQAISENPEIGILGAHYDSVTLSENPQLKYFSFQDYFKQAVRNTYFFTSATVVRKTFFDNKPGFDPRLKLGEDIDVWLRASLFFGDGLYIQNTLVFYGSEDNQRATEKQYLLEETLIPKILDPHYYEDAVGQSKCTIDEFKAFRDKWLYFMLYPMFKTKGNSAGISDVLDKMDSRYLLVRGIYKLPTGILRQLFSNRSICKIFRNYMKFCFRYIYV